MQGVSRWDLGFCEKVILGIKNEWDAKIFLKIGLGFDYLDHPVFWRNSHGLWQILEIIIIYCLGIIIFLDVLDIKI